MTRAWDRVVRTQSDEQGRERFTSELFSNRLRDWPERGEREAPKCRTSPHVFFGPREIFNKVHLLSTLKYWEISLKRSRFQASHKKINRDDLVLHSHSAKLCCFLSRLPLERITGARLSHEGFLSGLRKRLRGWRKFLAWSNGKQREEGAYVGPKIMSLWRAYTNWEHVGGSQEKLSGSGRRQRPCDSGEVGVWDAELWGAHETIEESTE